MLPNNIAKCSSKQPPPTFLKMQAKEHQKRAQKYLQNNHYQHSKNASKHQQHSIKGSKATFHIPKMQTATTSNPKIACNTTPVNIPKIC